MYLEDEQDIFPFGRQVECGSSYLSDVTQTICESEFL